MACLVSHSDDEIQALVQKQINEDMVRQKAIMDLALQFDNACTDKEDLRKAYEKYNDIPQESCNNKGTIDNIICQLGSVFALKDLESPNYFFGIEIVPHVSDILLSQKKYFLELLQRAGLSNCNLVSFNPVKYRQVVGSLLYVTLSRLDIAFAVNK
nr:hypothetical protein [Tanacetum cinerariifolium]